MQRRIHDHTAAASDVVAFPVQAERACVTGEMHVACTMLLNISLIPFTDPLQDIFVTALMSMFAFVSMIGAIFGEHVVLLLLRCCCIAFRLAEDVISLYSTLQV